MPLHEGQILERKYTVTRLLAEGGMGEIYLGVNERLDKPVAIKVLKAEFARDPGWVERFDREAKISARIRSEHVTNVFDLGELPSGERFIVMEYLEGESLAERLARVRRLEQRSLADIAAGILDGLVAAHTAGVVHRDLKPENVFLAKGARQDVVKLVDFGISMLVDPSKKAAKQTAPGAVLGTPMYMSPEQARGTTSSIDHRTDIYSLGVILYEAASGTPPFDGENVNELLFRIALDTAPALEAQMPSAHPELVAIVKKAMAKRPADRYASADEMRAAVLAWRATIPSDDEIPISVDLVATGLTATCDLAATELAHATLVSSPRRRSRAWLAVPLVACALAGAAVPLMDEMPPSVGAALGRLASSGSPELVETAPITIERTFTVERGSTLALSALRTPETGPAATPMDPGAAKPAVTAFVAKAPAKVLSTPPAAPVPKASADEAALPDAPPRDEPRMDHEPPAAPAASTDI